MSLEAEEERFVQVVPRDLEESRTSFYGSEALRYLNSDLKALLEKSDESFWIICRRSRSLHLALDSYLRYARRPHDIGETAASPDLNEGPEAELSRRVFMCYYRMVLPKLDGLAGEDDRRGRADALYREWMVDVPKLMDICAIYEARNPGLVRDLIKNAFALQPLYRSDLNTCLETVMLNCSQVIQKIMASEEDFGDLMDHFLYLVDAFSTLCAFVSVFGDPSLLFCPAPEAEEERRKGLEASHVFRFLLQSHLVSLPGVVIALDVEGTQVADGFKQVGKRVEAIVMGAVDHCFASHDAPGNGADLAGRTVIRLLNLVSAYEGEPNCAKILSRLESAHNLSERILGAVRAGHATMMKGQTMEVDRVLGSTLTAFLHPEEGEESSGRDALVEKQVETVRAILPEYGRAFIGACLKHYEYNVDVAVSHMMEGSLPYELAKLDCSLDTLPPAESVGQEDGASGGSGGEAIADFNFYKKREVASGSDSEDEDDHMDRQLVKERILEGLYEDDYDEDEAFAGDFAGHEADDLEGVLGDEDGASVGAGRTQPQQTKEKEFWVLENKVYNYSKPGATKVKATNAPTAIRAARIAEADEERAAGKKAREEKYIKEPRRSQQNHRSRGRGGGSGGGSTAISHKRKEKKKMAIGNHHRKERALRKQGGA